MKQPYEKSFNFKKYVPLSLKRMFIREIIGRISVNQFRYFEDKPKIVVALAADYGNLGDVAITYAQKEFLNKAYPGYQIIDFPISKTDRDIYSLKNKINEKDIITMVGGGNSGDIYDEIEALRHLIISNFPHNHIISFPQTVDYSATSKGERLLRKSKKIYSRHKNLTLVAREERSYKFYKKHFSTNKIILTPDIVLSLNLEKTEYDRNKIGLCLRNDKEQKQDSKLINENLISKISANFEIQIFDTHIPKNFMGEEERISELKKLIHTISSLEVVVTDRLHGMILCVITNTPCVVFDNSNKKISGVYNLWLSNNPLVRFVENRDINETILSINSFRDSSNSLVRMNYKNDYKEKFQALEKEIK